MLHEAKACTNDSWCSRTAAIKSQSDKPQVGNGWEGNNDQVELALLEVLDRELGSCVV